MATISAQRVAALVDGFSRTPAYAGLAGALRVLIGDGRIGLGVRLPSERELTGALDLSRTTVTRAYELLREEGYAVARRGAGTFTAVPGGRGRAHDRALFPRSADSDMIDLNCAAPSAPAGLAEAYAEAAEALPAYLSGHGYFPLGVPELQAAIADSYADRGLPTDPEQILVTPGALAAAAIVARHLTGPRDHVVVESPTYPNATIAIRNSGARLVAGHVDPTGWDLDALEHTIVQSRATTAYLIPDFQNPTGHLMSDEARADLARRLARLGTTVVVDEAHQSLALDPGLAREMPAPFAAHHRRTLSIGSASKSHWGGLRLGWVRAPLEQMERLVAARVGLDLGAPVLEQLVLVRLLAEPTVLAANRTRLAAQRDALITAVEEQLPDWRFHRPQGGLALWCELPDTLATAVCVEAERRGVIVTPGPVFAAEGGLDRFVRVPWTRGGEDLVAAVRRLADAWEHVVHHGGAQRPSRRSRRVLVA